MNTSLSGLSERFAHALELAFHLHQDQLRKGSDIPYIAHLLGVTALVLEDGGDEDEAIAALLHDAVEDQGGWETLESIRLQFGNRVAEIVSGCTDAFETPKPPWRERKAGYLAHLVTANPSIRRVSLADKLHNARTILTDLQRDPVDIWQRFRGGRDGTLWYYRELVRVFCQFDESCMVTELKQVVRAIEEIA